MGCGSLAPRRAFVAAAPARRHPTLSRPPTTPFQASMPKQYLILGGRPLAMHALAAFAALPEVGQVVVVCDPAYRWGGEWCSGRNKGGLERERGWAGAGLGQAGVARPWPTPSRPLAPAHRRTTTSRPLHSPAGTCFWSTGTPCRAAPPWPGPPRAPNVRTQCRTGWPPCRPTPPWSPSTTLPAPWWTRTTCGAAWPTQRPWVRQCLGCPSSPPSKKSAPTAGW